jgi:glycosyltransferase involved in cell wall biosynthesis
MPHVVIVNAVYPPEPVVSAQMGRDLAVDLAGIGARVTVLCPPPSRPLGADYVALQPAGCPLVRVEEGVEVVRLCSFASPRSRLLPRMWESWSFGLRVCHYLKHHLGDADVVYANTWPMLSQALLAQYCAGSGTPLVWHIKDLYPESLLGKLPGWASSLVAVPLVSMDRWIVRQAEKIVVLSESLRRVYLDGRGLPTEKVLTVPDWADEQRFARLPQRAAACARYGVPEDRFTFLYLGNIGPVAGVEFLIKAFHAARLPQAQLVIAGDGSAKARCIALARKLKLSGVQFVSDPEVANVPLLQSLGHVCLLPLRRGAGMSSIPSKLMAYLLSAKPVLATLDAASDTARCLRQARCGWVGEPEDLQWLAAKMAEVAALPAAELAAMGERGRAYGLETFSKAGGVRKLAGVVLSAVREAPAGAVELVAADR